MHMLYRIMKGIHHSVANLVHSHQISLKSVNNWLSY